MSLFFIELLIVIITTITLLISWIICLTLSGIIIINIIITWIMII